jgi:hypothetical protein
MSAPNAHPAALVEILLGFPRPLCFECVLLHLGEIDYKVRYHSNDQDDDSNAKPGIRIWRSKRARNAPANEASQRDKPNP